jgi:hypothetical protein
MPDKMIEQMPVFPVEKVPNYNFDIYKALFLGGFLQNYYILA